MSGRRAPRSAVRELLSNEAASGVVLIGAALLALLVANGPLGTAYSHALHVRLGPLSALHWINDGLMALFFLLVGLEMKRELADGHLSRWGDRALPALAALAGMAAPALVYLAATGGDPIAMRGWAIPTATDIAFAVGVMALAGPRVPASLKLLLASIAIVDDMGAVAVIALFYTASLDLAALGAAAILGLMLWLGRRGVTSLAVYLTLGALLWTATFLSGVHATIAGVAAALAVPLHPSPGRPDDAGSPLHRLQHALEPWVAFGIVPLFGFANAGLSLGGMDRAVLLSPVALGVGLGLFLGKQAGIFGAIRLAVALGLVRRPAGAGWRQVYGMALLCGIGFTMSLFIGGLAFADPAWADSVKLGVLGGSLLSALLGYAVLRSGRPPAAIA